VAKLVDALEETSVLLCFVNTLVIRTYLNCSSKELWSRKIRRKGLQLIPVPNLNYIPFKSGACWCRSNIRKVGCDQPM